MAELSAAQVMGLRKKTGLPMMECKQALTECNGDEAAAMEWLNKKHKGKMESRSDRETGEGRIGIWISEAGNLGGIIELRCETAPVAKNELFVDLANSIAKYVAEGNEDAPKADAITKAMEEPMTEVYGKLRETMKVGVCRKVTGEFITNYVHHDGKTGVMLAMNAKPDDDEHAKNTAMHVAFHKPLAIDRNGIPADAIEKVRAEATAAAKDEGKPDHIVEKIVEGKVNAFCAENALLEQEHARADLYDRKKVGDVLKEHGVTAVNDMVYIMVGA